MLFGNNASIKISSVYNLVFVYLLVIPGDGASIDKLNLHLYGVPFYEFFILVFLFAWISSIPSHSYRQHFLWLLIIPIVLYPLAIGQGTILSATLRDILSAGKLLLFLGLISGAIKLQIDFHRLKWYFLIGVAIDVLFLSIDRSLWDAKFQVEGSNRIWDFTSYFALLLSYRMLLYPSKKFNLQIVFLLFCFFSVILTQSKIMMALFIIICMYGLFLDLGKLKVYFVPLAFAIIYFFSVDQSRIVHQLNEVSVLDLLSIRYSPFVAYWNEASTIERLWGSGLGSTFFIPWFEYRGLNVLHAQVDNQILTMVQKYGIVFSVLYFFTCLWLIFKTKNRIIFKYICFALVGMTVAFSYNLYITLFLGKILSFQSVESDSHRNKHASEG